MASNMKEQQRVVTIIIIIIITIDLEGESSPSFLGRIVGM